jgi:hypothetical protein
MWLIQILIMWLKYRSLYNCQIIAYNTKIQCVCQRFDNWKLLLISAKFFFYRNDEVLLTKFIFQSSKFDVSTLNTQWSSLHASDFKEMAKIVTKQQHVWISVEETFSVSDCGGRRENFWGFSCEKSRFYDKKIKKNSILGGARAECAPTGSAHLHFYARTYKSIWF